MKPERQPEGQLRKIVGFHQDDNLDWVAELECGHQQHVRHNPPWTTHHWVTKAESRQAHIGQELRCLACPINREVSGGSYIAPDLKKEVTELERIERELQRVRQELGVRQTEIKKGLLAGATIEPGAHYAELRLIPGRDPNSKNPDDYDLVVYFVV